jgi:hypothetical protein
MTHVDSVITRPQPGTADVTLVYREGIFIGRITRAGDVHDCTGRKRQGDDLAAFILASVHDYSIRLAIPLKTAGAVLGYDDYRECRWCSRRVPAAALAGGELS